MTPDFCKAAIKAGEVLIKYSIRTSPVSPLPIIEQMDHVIVTSFAEMSDSRGVRQTDLMQIFGGSRDAVTSIHEQNGNRWYVVAYNHLLPFAIVQHALAREMGHIVLGHEASTPENETEALCFARHLLCPRPLIHAILATNIRLTKNLLAQMTGIFDQALTDIRKTPGTEVPAGMNRFIRGQFLPFFINFFQYYQDVLPADGSAIADLGTYMDGYEE